MTRINHKILLTIPSSGISGAESQLLALASGLKNRNYDVTLCCLGGQGQFLEKALKLKIKCIVINRMIKFDIFRLIKYFWIVNKNQYSIIISFTSVANNMTQILKIFLPYNNFIHFAGERGRDFNKNKIRNYFDSKLSRFSELIISNSKIQKKKLINYENIDSDKIEVIYNGFDFNLLNNISKTNLNKCFSIPKTDKVVVSIGNLTEPKNIPMFLNVAKNTIKVRTNTSFLYVGGSSAEKLKIYQDYVKSESLDHKIFFIGKQKNVLSILKSCDIFILTSSQEGMPNVLIESMASNIPVICTNVDGVAEIVKDGQNGLTVDSNDVEMMVEKINILLSNKDLYDFVRKNSLKDVMNIFQMDKMIESYEKLINKFLKF